MLADPVRNDELILVDGLDREVGVATKERAHAEGLLHRAFSVVILRDGAHGTELLLTQRAPGKYHSGGLWTNACCSHPRVGEKVLDAAYRRVREELGCEATGLREIGSFIYRAPFDNGLVEYEYDHVLVGGLAGDIVPDLAETVDVRWVSFEDVATELAKCPEKFTAWFYTVFSMVTSAKQCGSF